ncbi:chloride channel protein [Angustibacter luteus]|uniref:Chloride channel protein n=1 Tax=Angustibacter luteus TaxID=658456 RepID=A0ABW1JBX7_9ACTN
MEPEGTPSGPAPATAPSGGAYLKLVGLAALIGLPAAGLAAVFLAVVHWLEDLLWVDLPNHLGASEPPWYLVVGLPVVGAALVAAARVLLPGDGGHEPINGLDATPTPLSHLPGVALAALGSLAFGAVLGPEAPLIALGSVVGVAMIRLVKVKGPGGATLTVAGSFSAISALFGGPLPAGILLVEASVGLGAAAIPLLLPGLVAAAVGYLLFVGLGSWGGIDAATLKVSGLPAYEGTHLKDLVLAIAVGIVVAILCTLIRFGAHHLQRLRHTGLGVPGLLVLGGLAVGLIALATRALGADSQDLLFSGQASLPALVSQTSTEIVLVLLVGKSVAYAVCLGCGFRGGPVFPAIFIGVAVASAAGLPLDVSPTLAVAVGAAAGMAAMTRLLFASLLISALLVGTNGLDTVPAAVLACAAAWIVIHAMDQTPLGLPPVAHAQRAS